MIDQIIALLTEARAITPMADGMEAVPQAQIQMKIIHLAEQAGASERAQSAIDAAYIMFLDIEVMSIEETAALLCKMMEG